MKTTTRPFATVTLSIAVIVFNTMLFSGCTKEGPAGPQGAPGANGTNGTNGSANVQSVTLTASSFAWDATNDCRYQQWINIGILTSTVNSSGIVMVYEADGNGGWTAMPFSFNIGASGYTAHAWFSYNVGTVRVNVAVSDGSDPGSFSDTFKCVCIPPSQRKANPNLDLTNYNAVKAAFNLKD